jgi:V8-like Glu-specific endopeptidase
MRNGRMSYSRVLAAVAVVGAVAAGCSEESREPLVPQSSRPAMAVNDAQDPFQLSGLREVLSSPNPPAFKQVSPDMSVRFLGKGTLTKGTLTRPDFRDPPGAGDPNPNEPMQAPVGSMRLHGFNTLTRNQFEVVISGRLLKQVHDARVASGLTGASLGVSNPEAVEGLVKPAGMTLQDAQGPTTRGWSKGVDTRSLLTPTTSYPWRTVSQISYSGVLSDCTATMIGPRHLITAAHCIVDKGTSNFLTLYVAPGRDGNFNLPFDSSMISTSLPSNIEAWYFAPAEWIDPNTTKDQQWDWGLIVTPKRLGDRTGWMGYVANSFSTLDAATLYNRGYPSCNWDEPNRPANCQIDRMYGDSGECDLGAVYYPGSDGWNRVISHSCDTSAGHSGSALYHYAYDSNLGTYVPVVSMVNAASLCGGMGQRACTSTDAFPNLARRLTPSDLGVISWLRQTFP